MEANRSTADAVLSADGGAVAFESAATNIVRNDRNEAETIFIRVFGTPEPVR